MTKTDILILCKGKIVVYCWNVTKHINGLRQNARYFNIKGGGEYCEHFVLNVMTAPHGFGLLNFSAYLFYLKVLIETR